jgi:hypothetical protein
MPESKFCRVNPKHTNGKPEGFQGKKGKKMQLLFLLDLEPQQRAHSPLLTAGSASEYQN